MDTTTVLEIIKMIEHRRGVIRTIVDQEVGQHRAVLYGAECELKDLSNQLQGYIEGQLNAEENKIEP